MTNLNCKEVDIHVSDDSHGICPRVLASGAFVSDCSDNYHGYRTVNIIEKHLVFLLQRGSRSMVVIEMGSKYLASLVSKKFYIISVER